jgi:hypothetical protein
MSQEQTRLEKDFLKFHEENPDVWALFKRYTNAAIATGRGNYSAYAIFERIRWHQDIETRDDLGFKLNNNHRPYYARLFQAHYPKKATFFRTRQLLSKRPEQSELAL